MSTDLTSVATHGWYTEGTENLTTVSTFGWYGVTIADLLAKFPTFDFGLIINQLQEMGLTIEQQYDIDGLDITSELVLTPMQVAEIVNFNLRK